MNDIHLFVNLKLIFIWGFKVDENFFLHQDTSNKFLSFFLFLSCYSCDVNIIFFFQDLGIFILQISDKHNFNDIYLMVSSSSFCTKPQFFNSPYFKRHNSQPKDSFLSEDIYKKTGQKKLLSYLNLEAQNEDWFQVDKNQNRCFYF